MQDSIESLVIRNCFGKELERINLSILERGIEA